MEIKVDTTVEVGCNTVSMFGEFQEEHLRVRSDMIEWLEAHNLMTTIDHNADYTCLVCGGSSRGNELLAPGIHRYEMGYNSYWDCYPVVPTYKARKIAEEYGQTIDFAIVEDSRQVQRQKAYDVAGAGRSGKVIPSKPPQRRKNRPKPLQADTRDTMSPQTYMEYVKTCGNTQKSRFSCRACPYVGECK